MTSERSPVLLVDVAEDCSIAYNTHALIGWMEEEMFHRSKLGITLLETTQPVTEP